MKTVLASYFYDRHLRKWYEVRLTHFSIKTIPLKVYVDLMKNVFLSLRKQRFNPRHFRYERLNITLAQARTEHISNEKINIELYRIRGK